MRWTMVAASTVLFPGFVWAGGPTPAEILARAKAASGGGAWDAVAAVRIQARIHTGGLDGVVETLQDARSGRYVSRYELGPARGADGFDGSQPWSQDDSGQVRVEEGGDAREGAADEAYRTALAYWYPDRWPATVEAAPDRDEGGRSFHVLRITPKGGRPFELWIDAATFLVDRTVEKTALETRTVFVSDYREVNGLKVPFASKQSNGEAKYDQLLTVAAAEVNPTITEGAFTKPAPAAADFTIAAGATSTTVGFELVNNHIYIPVTLNGRGPYRLLCDTGGANVLTPELAAELGVKSEGALQGRGVGEKSEDFALSRLDTVQIGDATIRSQLAVVFPLSQLSDVEGIPCRGLVGYEVFKRFVVTVDYQRGTLTLTEPSTFAYRGSGTVVPFTFNEHVPQVEGSIDGIPGRFDIDTGSRASVDLLAPFVERNGLAAHFPARVAMVTGWGVGGPARGEVARAKSLRLGGVEVADPVVVLSAQKKGAFSDPYVAGNVGGNVLRRFTVTFDYARKQIIFERNASFGAPDVFDRSGMWINASGDAFTVVDAVAGGPAAEAGVKVGDRIVAVDGVPAAKVRLPDLRLRLRSDHPGTRVTLTLAGEKGTRAATLTLRDLV